MRIKLERDMNVEAKSRFSLAGFTLGVMGIGAAISLGLLTLIIVLNKVGRVESGAPSLSSMLMIALCALVFGMSLFVFWGSMGIWGGSAKGGAINFGIGVVLLALSQGLMILLSDFLDSSLSLWIFLSFLGYLMGVAVTLSGILGIVANLTRK
jgi:hypothetical protein